VNATHWSFAVLACLSGALCSFGCKSEHGGTQDAGTSPNPSVLTPVPESGHLVFRPTPDSAVEPASDTAAQLVVSGSRIGPIPVDSSMGYIARLLPSYTVDSGYLETTPIIGWDFTIRGFSVWASQQYSSIDRDFPAVSWIIRGPGVVVLPGPVRVHLPTVWGQLRKVLPGRVEISSGETGTLATFCGLPHLAFGLDVEFGVPIPDAFPPDSIGSLTPISSIQIGQPDDTVRCVQ
jgi:hypothetical protein